MTYKIKTLTQHLDSEIGGKRILSLDGGGCRGIVTLAFLKEIETLLKSRHGGSEEFRLSHYFDLIAGTSTGAIIAAALSMDWSVDEITNKYFSLANSVFKKSLFRKGFIRAEYDENKLIKELKDVYGKDTKIGSENVLTGLLIITKRLDSGSPWPVSNNPKGKYYHSDSDGLIGNKEYLLWQIVRASTAAPKFFEPEKIEINSGHDQNPIVGNFVDGGVSPFNNPALQALMYATIEGYKLNWNLGEDNLLLVSIGTGVGDVSVGNHDSAMLHAIHSLKALMDDCSTLQDTILQWLSNSPTARKLDGELEYITNNIVGESARLSYLRYNLDLSSDNVNLLLKNNNIDDRKVKKLTEMDAPENMSILHKLAEISAKRDIDRYPIY